MFQTKGEPSPTVSVTQATAALTRGRDRMAAGKKKALEQGLEWPPPLQGSDCRGEEAAPARRVGTTG
jgi:hypothetical protein